MYNDMQHFLFLDDSHKNIQTKIVHEHNLNEQLFDNIYVLVLNPFLFLVQVHSMSLMKLVLEDILLYLLVYTNKML